MSSLESGFSEEAVNQLIQELSLLYKAVVHPFPYRGCRRLLKTTSQRTRRYEDLIPELDVYWSTLAGYCRGGRRIRRCSRETLLAAQAYASRSFFEAVPHYQRLERRITRRFVPDLYADLCHYDQMRHTLLELLALLLMADSAIATSLNDDAATT
jgi:hypothetical protein